jgi:uncharacterized spore protein YtfJ
MISEHKIAMAETAERTSKAAQSKVPAHPDQPKSFITAVQGPLEKFMEAARVEAAIGAPIEHGDSLVIPTAEVINVMGFGMGTGPAHDEDEADEARPGGGGGGGQALARPVAVIVMSPAGVRVEPVVDVTKIALAVFTAAGFISAMVWRMSRSRPTA